MLSRLKLYRFVWLLLIGGLVLAGCGDPTATVAPTKAAATTAASTTSAAAADAGSADPQKIAAGQKVFVTQCQVCHLNGGKSSGGAGPNLAFSKKSLDADRVRKNVRNGAEAMPAFDQTKLPDADLENIVLYVKSIYQS